MITFNALKFGDEKEISKIFVENKVLLLSKGDKVKISYTNGSRPFLDSIIQHTPQEKGKQENCINCNGKLKPNSAGTLQCFNWRCSSAKLRGLLKYCKTMGIKTRHGGPSLIANLHNKGLLSKPSDLYRLIPEDLDGNPEHVIRLFFAEIANSKNKPLFTFMGAFEAGNINPRTLAKLCDNSGSLQKLVANTEKDLIEQGLKPKSAKALSHLFQSHKAEFEYFASIGMGQKANARTDNIDENFDKWKKKRAEIVDLLKLIAIKTGIFMTETENLRTTLRLYQSKNPEIAATSRTQDSMRHLLKYVLIFTKKLS
jgi:NAD-dependent DNA ligase